MSSLHKMAEMADGEDSNGDEPAERKPLSPIVGTPCDELDATDMFEGYFSTTSRFSFEDDHETSYLSPTSEIDSASSEPEDLYVQELGVTPPRNIRRNKEKSKTGRKVQGLCLRLPDRSEIDRQKKRDRDRNRETSQTRQTQLRTERAFMRQYKRNSLGNTFSNDTDLSRSLNIPSVKIESRRFMSLKCTRQDKERGLLKRSESDPKNLVQLGDDLSQNKQEFLRTFSLLIKIGAHARQQRDCQFALTEVERQTSEEHKQWQVKLCLALWLELRAWHSGRTMEEQDQFLVEERAHVDDVLDKIINFDLTRDKMSSASLKEVNSDSNDKATSSMQPVELIVTNFDNDCANIHCSTPVKTHKSEDNVSMAANGRKRTMLKSTIEQHSLEEEEIVTPQCSESLENIVLSDKESNASETFVSDNMHDTTFLESNLLVDDKHGSNEEESLILNSEKMPTHDDKEKANVTPNETKNLVKDLEIAINKIERVFEDLEAAEKLYSTQRALGEANTKYVSRAFTRNHDALVLWMNMVSEMLQKLTLAARFIGIERGISKELWQDWYDVGMDMYGKY